MKRIEWKKVTWFSQIVAIILFVGIFYWGFYLGGRVSMSKVLGNEVARANFQCENNKSINAIFYKNAVRVTPSNHEEVFLLQTISASGARYTNRDESLVFWNKGDTAFITEGNPNIQTYKGCVVNK
jgi:membrane-bound inhibitor of C-type lysozyme